jgi:hypothetical protein
VTIKKKEGLVFENDLVKVTRNDNDTSSKPVVALTKTTILRAMILFQFPPAIHPLLGMKCFVVESRKEKEITIITSLEQAPADDEPATEIRKTVATFGKPYTTQAQKTQLITEAISLCKSFESDFRSAKQLDEAPAVHTFLECKNNNEVFQKLGVPRKVLNAKT